MVDESERPSRVKVEADAAYSANAAGQALRGQGAIEIAGVPIILGLGGGILNLDYMSHPLGYGGGNVRFDTNIGLRGHLYGQASLAVFPETSATVAQTFEAARLGTTWDIIPRRGKVMLRVGLEASAKTAFTLGGLDQLYEEMGMGASFGYGPLVAYGIGRLTFGPETPTQQFWVDALRPWPQELKVGAVMDVRGGTEAGAEVSVAPFERGGRLFFNLRSPVPSQLSMVYRHTSTAFGGTHELGGSAAFRLDSRVSRIMVSTKAEGGGESLGKYEHQSLGDMDSRSLTGFLYGTGRIGLAEYVQRMNPTASVGDVETRTYGGRQFQVVNYWIHGVQYSFSGGVDPEAVKSGMRNRARHALGDSAYNFLEALFSSSSLEQFAGRYAGSTTDQKIYAAARLAQLGHEGYDDHLLNVSFFSSEKKKLEALDPTKVFSNIRKSLLDGKQRSGGICGNINGMAAEFLRLSGVEAYALGGLGSGDTMHVIAAARDPGSNASYVVDYGSVYKTQSTGVWPAVQAYSRENGIVLMGAYVYGKGNGFIGYFKAPEGRLLETVTRTDEDALREALIRK